MSVNGNVVNAAEVLKGVETRLFINNEFVQSKSGKTFQLYDPASEEPTVKVYAAEREDVDIAVEAAKAIAPSWAEVDASDRAEALEALANLISQHEGEFARLEAVSMGNPVTAYGWNVKYAVDTLKYYAGLARDIRGASSLGHKGFLNLTLEQPYGVTAAIIPWNVPLIMIALKVAPALAAGNCLIVKSSEKAPLTSLLFAKLAKKTGMFPPGVLQVLSGLGDPCGVALAEHMDIRRLAFTGSGRTGRLIRVAAAKSNLKNVTLELGGKSPLIIFDDADIDQAAPAAAFSIAANSGQICMASSRVYVHKNVAEPFTEKFQAQFRAMLGKWGNPLDPSVTHGPQADKAQYDHVMKFLESGKQGGGRLLMGGTRLGEKGHFIQPTIFQDAPESSDIMRGEIFGPVVCISTFESEEDVVKRANDTEYGLYASVFTKNNSRAIRMAKKLEAGNVSINCTSPTTFVDMPLGGFRGSGDGREYGRECLDHWTETKTVLSKINETKCEQ